MSHRKDPYKLKKKEKFPNDKIGQKALSVNFREN